MVDQEFGGGELLDGVLWGSVLGSESSSPALQVLEWEVPV